MREIKFRAWDKTLNKWTGDLVYAIGRISESNDWERFDICEFTGLKDKNGKEIYEGDILGVYGDNSEEPKRWAVSWVNTNYTACFSFGYMPSCNYCEIIGNIYETPELLEDPKNEK